VCFCSIWRSVWWYVFCGVSGPHRLDMHVFCLSVWVFVTIYGNGWYFYHWISFVNLNTPIGERFVKRLIRTWSTSDLYSNSWRLIDSEIDILNSYFYLFIKKSIIIPRGRTDMGCYLFFWVRFSSISCFFARFVYCQSPWDLFVQYIEHLCTCYAESQITTKAVYGLSEWPQFMYVIVDLKLLRKISTVRLFLKKRHN
jgi:hypothetical protein